MKRRRRRGPTARQIAAREKQTTYFHHLGNNEIYTLLVAELSECATQFIAYGMDEDVSHDEKQSIVNDFHAAVRAVQEVATKRSIPLDTLLNLMERFGDMK